MEKPDKNIGMLILLGTEEGQHRRIIEKINIFYKKLMKMQLLFYYQLIKETMTMLF